MIVVKMGRTCGDRNLNDRDPEGARKFKTENLLWWEEWDSRTGGVGS